MKNRKFTPALLLVICMAVSVLATSCSFGGHTHSFGEWSIVTEPTETAVGKATRSCECGEAEEKDLPVLTDTSVWTAEVVTPASHTAAGQTKYTSEYGQVTVSVAALAHTFGELSVETQATLTETGIAKRFCTENDGGEEVVTIPVLTDDSVWSVKSETPATHLEAGETVYTSVYGDVTVTLAKTTEHTYGNWVITADPTTDAAGKATGTCECSATTEVDVPALTDTSVWSVKSHTDASHTAAGETVYTSVYGDVTVTIAMIAHTYGDWVITADPTTDAAGKATGTCECSATTEIDVPALSDTSVWSVKSHTDASHTATGETVYTSVYGDVTVTIAMIAHTYGDWVITADPTTDAAGKATGTCECTATTEIDVPALTDTSFWSKKSETPATHMAAGETVYTSAYGDVTVAIAKIADHSYGDWEITVEPTADAVGKATGTCECTATTEVDVPALSDDTVWTLASTAAATYAKGATATYTSVYGEVTIVTSDPLPPPFATGTYRVVDVYGSSPNGSTSTVGTHSAAFTVSADGTVTASTKAFPFNGTTMTFSGFNAETGAITYTKDGTAYKGFLDVNTGILMVAYYTDKTLSNDVLLCSPFETAAYTAKVASSYWNSGNTRVLTYTGNETTYNYFVKDSTVYAGVTFESVTGEAIGAKDCYNAASLYVKSGTTVIDSYGYNGTTMVALDGLEGVYTAGEKTVVVNGMEKITLDSVDGTYEKISENVIGAYVDGSYYEITLSVAEKTAAIDKPMVTVTFNTDGKATVAPISVNKNIAITLPIPENDNFICKGWYITDETEMLGATFTPTGDVTLNAVWKQKVHYVLHTGTSTVTVVVAEGDNLLDAFKAVLEDGAVDPVTEKVFSGWYVTEESFDDADKVTADIAASTSDDMIDLYAYWKEIPLYAGEYVGNNVYGASYARTDATLTITPDGVVSGYMRGTVVAYDKVTGMITIQDGNYTRYLFYNKATNTIACESGTNNYIDDDFEFFSKYARVVNTTDVVGIRTPNPTNPTSFGYYMHVVLVKDSKDDTAADTVVVIYNQTIAAVGSMETLEGEAINTLSALKNNAKSLVLKDKAGNILFRVQTTNNSLLNNSSCKSVILDAYLGTYDNAGKTETVVLDGKGGITYGAKTGTYAKNESGWFDVYFGENETLEYYKLTLDTAEMTFAIEKPMVTVTLVSDHGGAAVLSLNVNVPYTFVSPDDTATHVFRGWKIADAVVTSLTPVEDVTVTADWQAKAVLTIVYNNGAANHTVNYAVGEIIILEKPVYTAHKFVGWFTNEGMTDALADNTAITADTTVYAKWEDADFWYDTFAPVGIQGTTTNGGVSSLYDRATYPLVCDPDGNAISKGAPFGTYNKAIVVSWDNKAQNKVKIVSNGSGTSTTTQYAYVDPVTHMMITEYTGGNGFKEVILATPLAYTPNPAKFTSSNVTSSYWNSGKTRAIDYVFDETHYGIFVMDGNVYFGVTFTDLGGNAVAAKDCYKAETLIVKDSKNAEIARFGYNGTTMVALDGNEGTFTNEADTLYVNGISGVKLNGVDGSYVVTDAGIGITVDGEYFDVTLNKAEKTYVIVKPMVDITFSTDGKATVSPVNTNKNIAITLPAPTNTDFVFRGWYIEGASETLLNGSYVPTESVTLIAKWDLKVTVTVVYGNGIQNEVQEYGVGDTPVLTAPAPTAGKAFVRWLKDGAAYTPAALEESITVTAEWMDAVAQFGTYKGSEVRWYTTGTNLKNYSLTETLVINPDGTTTCTYSRTTPFNGAVVTGETDGVLNVTNNGTAFLAYYSAELGVIWTVESTSTKVLDEDTLVFFIQKDDGTPYVTKMDAHIYGSSFYSYHNSTYTIPGTHFTFIAKLTYSDSSVRYALFCGGKIYADVTWTNFAEKSFNNINTSSSITYYDAGGEVIVSK